MNCLTLRHNVAMLLSCVWLSACSINEHYAHLPLEAHYSFEREIQQFDDYVAFLKRKAAGQGVSNRVLNAQKNIDYIERAVQLDKQQANRKRRPHSSMSVPNPQGVTNYVNKVLTPDKIKRALGYWQTHQPALSYASQQYGVQKSYLMALWGMESSFGRYQGNFDVLSVLATLAFDGRREKLFTQEFVNALKMLQQGAIAREEMRGSWAGAMGQTQFMPSAYLNYAVDGNRDRKKDIWTNSFDAFASMANYLARVGWDKHLPWGVEVKLAQPIDLSFAGVDSSKAKSWAEWRALGVYLAYPHGQENDKLNVLSQHRLWLVRPDGEQGRSFLVSNNYRTLLHWNRSHYFAISIGKFADRIVRQIQ